MNRFALPYDIDELSRFALRVRVAARREFASMSAVARAVGMAPQALYQDLNTPSRLTTDKILALWHTLNMPKSTLPTALQLMLV